MHLHAHIAVLKAPVNTLDISREKVRKPHLEIHTYNIVWLKEREKRSLKLCSTGSKYKHTSHDLFSSILNIPVWLRADFHTQFPLFFGALKIKTFRPCMKRQTIFLCIKIIAIIQGLRDSIAFESLHLFSVVFVVENEGNKI